MVVSAAPMTVHPSGMQVATALPKGITTPTSNMPGGLLNAAAARTAASIQAQASHAKAAGVTMKGGGTVVQVPPAAEGGSIPGVSFAGNHANLTGIANQLKAGAVYDGLAGGQPYKIGGTRHKRLIRQHRRRFVPEGRIPTEEPAILAGGKHRRRTKKHVRRSRSRSNRRSSRKHVHNHRRTRRRNTKR